MTAETTLARYGVTIEEYRAVHHFLRKNAVKTGRCTNRSCGRTGRTHWSLRPGRKYEKVLANFRELCQGCAQRVDRGGTLTHCPQGHDRSKWTYIDKDGHSACYLCIIERSRELPRGSLRRLPRPFKRRARRAPPVRE